MTPWTPRERALRAALEPFAKQHKEIEEEAHRALQFGGYLPIDQPDISIDMWATNGLTWKHLTDARAALTDTPPPDPRDAALGLAEAELLRLWKLVPAGRAGVGGVRTIELEDDEVARLRQIVDAIRAAKGGA